MKLCLIFSQLLHILIFATIEFSSTKKTTEYTLPIQKRIDILKSRLAKQINRPFLNDGVHSQEAVNENVEYEDNNSPITPINEKDPRKKRGLFKLHKIKTIATPKALPVSVERYFHVEAKKKILDGKINIPRNLNTGKQRLQPIVKSQQKRKKVKKSKITDVFYRRSKVQEWTQTIKKWTHCQDLITPFLSGHKVNMTEAKRVTSEDHEVQRLLQLLSEDTTDHSKDDITSILYQISNLNQRLFQWDTPALGLLFNAISKDETTHTFKTLKQGLKEVFETWNLDVSSNIAILLKQTRIFRPPCVTIAKIEGSTQTSKVYRYSKKPKKLCPIEDDEEC